LRKKVEELSALLVEEATERENLEKKFKEEMDEMKLQFATLQQQMNSLLKPPSRAPPAPVDE
jgi:protein subunit release factor A